jgi:hypothetical protein
MASALAVVAWCCLAGVLAQSASNPCPVASPCSAATFAPFERALAVQAVLDVVTWQPIGVWPFGLSVGPTTGRVTWTPTAGQTGSFVVVFAAAWANNTRALNVSFAVTVVAGWLSVWLAGWPAGSVSLLLCSPLLSSPLFSQCRSFSSPPRQAPPPRRSRGPKRLLCPRATRCAPRRLRCRARRPFP